MIYIAGSAGRLSRGGRRHLPGLISKIEKLRHIHLRRVSPGQTGQTEPSFDELINGSVIRHGVRHKVLFGEWRYHDQGNAKTRKREIAIAAPVLTPLPLLQGSPGNRSLGRMPSGLTVGCGGTWSKKPPYSSKLRMNTESFHEELVIRALIREETYLDPTCTLPPGEPSVPTGCSSRALKNPGSIMATAGRLPLARSLK